MDMRSEFPRRPRKTIYGLQREPPSGSVAVDALLVKAAPAPLQGMFSACQSANRALICVRRLWVPPVAVPPGTLAAWPPPIPTTVTFALLARLVGVVVSAVPWKPTVGPDL